MVQSLTSHTAYAIVGSMVQSLTSYTAYLKGSRGLIEFSIVLTVNMDMTDFDPIEQVEEDYDLEDFFPSPIPYHLQPLIEYRVKLLLKKDTFFSAGETQVVNTSCMLKGKVRKNQNLSMHLIPYENLPLSLESKGYISRRYSGRVVIKLTNYSATNIKLSAGTAVAYIVMQPFSLE